MSRAISHYVTASRIVVSAKPADPETWRGLHSLLRSIHDRLLCRTCDKLIDRSNACDRCDTRLMTGVHTNSLVRCYMHLCGVLRASPVYGVMRARREDAAMVDLVEDVLGVFEQSASDNDSDVESLYSDGVRFEEEVDDENPVANRERPSNCFNSHEPDTGTSSVDVREPGTSNERYLDSYNSVDLKPKEYSKNNALKNQLVVKNQTADKTIKAICCSCGRNKKKGVKINVKTCFQHRCICFKNHKNCSACSCIGCKNPFVNNDV